MFPRSEDNDIVFVGFYFLERTKPVAHFSRPFLVIKSARCTLIVDFRNYTSISINKESCARVAILCIGYIVFKFFRAISINLVLEAKRVLFLLLQFSILFLIDIESIKFSDSLIKSTVDNNSKPKFE